MDAIHRRAERADRMRRNGDTTFTLSTVCLGPRAHCRPLPIRVHARRPPISYQSPEDQVGEYPISKHKLCGVWSIPGGGWGGGGGGRIRTATRLGLPTRSKPFACSDQGAMSAAGRTPCPHMLQKTVVDQYTDPRGTSTSRQAAHALGCQVLKATATRMRLIEHTVWDGKGELLRSWAGETGLLSAPHAVQPASHHGLRLAGTGRHGLSRP